MLAHLTPPPGAKAPKDCDRMGSLEFAFLLFASAFG